MKRTIEESLIEFIADIHQITLGKGMVREIVVDDATFDRCVDELGSETRLAFLPPLRGDGGGSSRTREARAAGVVRFNGPIVPFEFRTLDGGRISHALRLLTGTLHALRTRLDVCIPTSLADEISAAILALSGKKPEPLAANRDDQDYLPGGGALPPDTAARFKRINEALKAAHRAGVSEATISTACDLDVLCREMVQLTRERSQ